MQLIFAQVLFWAALGAPSGAAEEITLWHSYRAGEAKGLDATIDASATLASASAFLARCRCRIGFTISSCTSAAAGAIWMLMD